MALTMFDTEMTYTVFQDGMTTIIGFPECIGDVPMDKDFPRLSSAENKGFGNPTVRACMKVISDLLDWKKRMFDLHPNQRISGCCPLTRSLK